MTLGQKLQFQIQCCGQIFVSLGWCEKAWKPLRKEGKKKTNKQTNKQTKKKKEHCSFASRGISWGGSAIWQRCLLCTTNWEETPGQTQNWMEGLHISSGLGKPLGSPVGAAKCCWGEECLKQSAKPPASATRSVQDGWMDGWWCRSTRCHFKQIKPSGVCYVHVHVLKYIHFILFLKPQYTFNVHNLSKKCQLQKKVMMNRAGILSVASRCEGFSFVWL